MMSKEFTDQWIVPMVVLLVALSYAKKIGVEAMIAVSVVFYFGYLYVEYRRIKKQVMNKE